MPDDTIPADDPTLDLPPPIQYHCYISRLCESQRLAVFSALNYQLWLITNDGHRVISTYLVGTDIGSYPLDTPPHTLVNPLFFDEWQSVIYVGVYDETQLQPVFR